MHPRRNKYINTCFYCEIKFHPFIKEAKYCSYECANKARRKGKEVSCVYCRKQVYKKNKLFSKTKLFYCNKECKDLDSKYTTARNELKRQARRVVTNKVIKGEIKKMNCEICNNLKTHAHHYLGYEKEHWLDIKWLCVSHHAKEHQRLIREKHV